MYLKANGIYYAGSEQRCRSAPFLLLFSDDDNALRACVRSVAMHQCGHFMMGRALIGAGGTVRSEYLKDGEITVSGSYGHDGLPLNAPTGKFACLSKITVAAWDRLLTLPEELTACFWKGGGHNSAGNEAGPVRSWALENLDELRTAGKPARAVKRAEAVAR